MESAPANMNQPVQQTMLVQSASLVVAAVCFGLLGAVTARQLPGVLPVVIFFILGAVYGAIGIFCCSFLLSAVNAKVDFHTALGACALGFLALVPFTALALVAELMLGWSAAQVFTSAGLMAAGGAAGMELSRQGASGKTATLLPALLGFALSFGWLTLSALLAAQWQAG